MDKKLDFIGTLISVIYCITCSGYDQEGAVQLSHKLIKTKKWIGATDITADLRFMGLG